MFNYQGRVHLLSTLRTLGGWFVALYTDSIEPDEATVWADLAEASFPGYSQQAPTLDAVTLNGSNQAETNFSSPVTFTQTSNAAAQLVYGAVIINTYGGGNYLYDWLHFPAPISMSTAGQSITIDNWRIREGEMVP